MNFYGIATGTDTYALSVSERSELRPGDIVTVVFLHDNTGASTLNVNGFGPVPLLRNASAMSAGDLVASTTYQFCYTGASFVQDVQASTGATTNNFAGTYCGINSSQTITASTLTDVLWDEIISETANLSHTTGAAPFTSNLTQYYDIDIVVVPQSSNTSGYTNGAYLALVVDGATVAKQPHSLYNDTGPNWENPIFVINATVQVASTKDFKVQFYPGGSNVDLLGKDSAAYRCTIRVRERGV